MKYKVILGNTFFQVICRLGAQVSNIQSINSIYNIYKAWKIYIGDFFFLCKFFIDWISDTCVLSFNAAQKFYLIEIKM